ncbi:MAG: hypothetical protein ACI87A_003467, partial [Planctomycetota bacterium]
MIELSLLKGISLALLERMQPSRNFWKDFNPDFIPHKK